MGKEAKFSRDVVLYLRSRGALVNVNTANIFEVVGRSDVEACYNGYFIALELKTGNYQPDPLQIRYLQKVRDAGGYGLLLRDKLDDLIELLNYLDNMECAVYYGADDKYFNYQQPELPQIKHEKWDIEYD